MAYSLRDVWENKKLSPLAKNVLVEIERGKGMPRHVDDIARACGFGHDTGMRVLRELQRHDILARPPYAGEHELKYVQGSPYLGFLLRQSPDGAQPYHAPRPTIPQETEVFAEDGGPLDDSAPAPAEEAPKVNAPPSEIPKRNRRGGGAA